VALLSCCLADLIVVALRLYSSLKMAVRVNFRIMQVSRTPSHRPTSVRKVVSTAKPFQWQLEEGIRVNYSGP
jgi:hypothetical protein